LLPKVNVPAIEHLEPKFSEHANRSEVMDAIQRMLGAYGLDRSQVRVTQVGIQLVFISDGIPHPADRAVRLEGCGVSCRAARRRGAGNSQQRGQQLGRAWCRVATPRQEGKKIYFSPNPLMANDLRRCFAAFDPCGIVAECDTAAAS